MYSSFRMFLLPGKMTNSHLITIDNVQTTGNNTTLHFEFPYFSSSKLQYVCYYVELYPQLHDVH